MGHTGKDSIEALRALARRLRDESASAVPPFVPGPAYDGIPQEAATAMGAPHLIAVLVAFAFILFVGGAGAAYAADRAIPGDVLYPVDVFLEELIDAVGIRVDHTAERLDEASRLLEAGRTADAVALLQTGLREAKDESWTEPAMQAVVAATAVASDPETSDEVDDALATLIETAKAADAGTLDAPGTAVAEAARDLAEVAADTRRAPGRPTDPGNGNPPTDPGNGNGNANGNGNGNGNGGRP